METNCCTLNLDYNPKFDVLNLKILSTDNSYGDEEIPSTVILRDIKTDDITGITFFGFVEKYKNGNLPKLLLPFNIDYESIFIQIKKLYHLTN